MSDQHLTIIVYRSPSLTAVPLHITRQTLIDDLLALLGPDPKPDRHSLYSITDNDVRQLSERLNGDQRAYLYNHVYYGPDIRPQQVMDLDSANKKIIMLDQTDTVQNLTGIIAKKFDIDDASELSLQRYQRSSSSQLQWLRPDQPLYNQISTQHVVILRKKFFLLDQSLTADRSALLHFTFLEARHSILTGVYEANFDQTVQFAALMMQIAYGNYDPLIHVAGFMDVMEFLPAPYRSSPFIEEYVYREHRRLKNVDANTCKLRFLRRCFQLSTYGVTYAEAREQSSDDAYSSDILLGANCNFVLILNRSNKEVFGRHLLVEINGTELSGNRLTLRLKGRDRHFYFESDQDAILLHDLIAGYTSFQRTRREQTNLATFAVNASLIVPKNVSCQDLSNMADCSI